MIARNKPPVRIGAGLNFRACGPNRGNNVSVHVSYRALLRGWAFRPNIKRSELDVPQKEACDRARASSDANPIGGVTVFPGVPVFVEQGTGISGVYKTDDPVLFSILGCVDYTYLGNRHGQTGFRMLLGHVDKGRIYGIPFVEGKPHPYEEPVPPELLAHGYPTDPPKEYLLQPNEFVFQPEDSGNYAR